MAPEKRSAVASWAPARIRRRSEAKYFFTAGTFVGNEGSSGSRSVCKLCFCGGQMMQTDGSLGSRDA